MPRRYARTLFGSVTIATSFTCWSWCTFATSRAAQKAKMAPMRLGIADHFGWAVAVVATPRHDVVVRRRIALVEPGVTEAPIHYEARRHDDAALTALVATVRASVERATSAAFDELAVAAGEPITSISLRSWPDDFPRDIAVVRRSPWEARADAVMYREVLAKVAEARGWRVRTYDAKRVVARAVALLGRRADDVLHGPRATLGAPWANDHRVALAATIVVE